jgi:ribose-phosphate pyrophosphokinase
LTERQVDAAYLACTHAVLSGPAVERLAGSVLREVVVTDTVPVPPSKRWDRLTVLSVAPMLAEAIRRIHTGESVSSLFS